MKKIFVLIILTYLLAACDRKSTSKIQNCNEKAYEIIAQIVLDNKNEFDAIIKIEHDSLSPRSKKIILENLKIRDDNFLQEQIKCFEKVNLENLNSPKTKIVTLKEFENWMNKNPTTYRPKEDFISDMYPRGIINFERIIFSENYLEALVITTLEKSNSEINQKVVIYHFDKRWKIEREIPYFSN